MIQREEEETSFDSVMRENGKRVKGRDNRRGKSERKSVAVLGENLKDCERRGERLCKRRQYV